MSETSASNGRVLWSNVNINVYMLLQFSFDFYFFSAVH